MRNNPTSLSVSFFFFSLNRSKRHRKRGVRAGRNNTRTELEDIYIYIPTLGCCLRRGHSQDTTSPNPYIFPIQICFFLLFIKRRNCSSFFVFFLCIYETIIIILAVLSFFCWLFKSIVCAICAAAAGRLSCWLCRV